MDDDERKLRRQAASYRSWASGDRDPVANTQAARDALWQRYLTQADPEGKLDSAERERRAVALRRADLAERAANSARARRERKLALLMTDEAEAA